MSKRTKLLAYLLGICTFSVSSKTLLENYTLVVQWWIQDFPLGGGRQAVGGALTSDVGAFWQKHMRKRKNWILLGGGGARAGGAPPDPPMGTSMNYAKIMISLVSVYDKLSMAQNTTV